jgi:hypothetical protein
MVGVEHGLIGHVEIEGGVLDLGGEGGALAADRDRGFGGADAGEGLEE